VSGPVIRILGASEAELVRELRGYVVDGVPSSGLYSVFRTQALIDVVDFLTDGETRLAEARQKIMALFAGPGT